jgi:hypothetical protein
VTLKEMRDQVVRWLGLQDVDAYSETSMVNDQLYYGILDLLARTRCVVRCVQLRVTADQDEYMLDHGILTLVEVADGQRRSRRNESYPPTAFTLVGADMLRVQPVPDEDGLLQVDAVIRPQKMAADTDSPGDETFGAIPDEYHDAIVTYALWKLSDYTDDQTGQQGERYRILYEGQNGNGGRLSQIRSSVHKRGTARAPRARVHVRPVHSNLHWMG